MKAVPLRLFLTAWIVFSAHFATNVMREHYPAFSLVDRRDFVLDEYAGFHSDIFEHTDGHHYVGNQVAPSMLASVPLFLFDPVLDSLQERRLAQLEAGGGVPGDYRTEYPLRAEFYKKVVARGLDLRFGAATAVTTVFLIAPLSALLVVLLHGLLLRRGVRRKSALWLSMLFAFGTPVFYRTATLNNNILVMYAVFGAFLLLWDQKGEGLTGARRFLSGVLAGLAVACDYAGGIVLPFLWLYLVLVAAARTTPMRGEQVLQGVRESIPFVVGLLPGFLLLWGTQWAMYGDPFLPGQYHMPEVNYTESGWRGISPPQLDLFLDNLFSPNWGLVPFGPLLVLGFVPLVLVRPLRRTIDVTVFPRPERRFFTAYAIAFLLFCAANQYSRMQWNTGFRYLLPLVPFLFLQASDVLLRLPRRLVTVLGAFAIAHTWVLCQSRYLAPGVGGAAEGNAVLGCWRRVLTEGVQLPWLNVLRQTSGPGSALHAGWIVFLPLVIAGVLITLIWRVARAA